MKTNRLPVILALGMGIAAVSVLLWLADGRPTYAADHPPIIPEPTATLGVGVGITDMIPLVGEESPAQRREEVPPGAPAVRVRPGLETAAQEEPLMLTFYYPWFDMAFWDSPFLVDRPLEPYNSNDPVAIARHVSMGEAAGIDVFVSSWAGRDYPTFDSNLALLLDAMVGTDMRATIYLESPATNFTSTNKIATELEYLLDTHADHPRFFHKDGRPVIFIYGIRWVNTDAHETPDQVWTAVMDQLHADGYNPYVVADTIDPAYLDRFDGLFSYLPLESTPVYQSVSCQAHQAGKLWVGTIYPGFDDRSLFWRDPYHLHIPRRDGQTYSDTLTSALYSGSDWIAVTSFNEWYENTHIEPGTVYGNAYLSQTARLAARFESWQPPSEVYVDAAYTGAGDGSTTRPLATLDEALLAAADGATVRVAGGVYTGPFTLTRDITVLGGFDPTSWTRNDPGTPTVLQGAGNGPVVRVMDNPCAASPQVRLDGVEITGGVAKGDDGSGAGLRAEGAAVRLVDVALHANQAQNHGGAIFVSDGGELAVEAAHIYSNSARVGGGIFVGAGSRLAMSNTLLHRNVASIAGGGVYAGPTASATIVNSTLTANDAARFGEGVYAWGLAPDSFNLVNSILWNNHTNDLRCLGACSITYSDVAGGSTGSGNLNVDPGFWDAGQADFHLQPGSTMINAGDPDGVVPAGPAPLRDIDGDVRPWGGGVDIGADEFGPLGSSSVTVDKRTAQPGDTLHYTIILTSTETSQPLQFWLTDTLPGAASLITGSLQTSAGSAVYTSSTGTAYAPRILWTGQIGAGGRAQMSFDAGLSADTALNCTQASNKVHVRTDVSTLERQAVTKITDGQVGEIAILDGPGGAGGPVTKRTLHVGDSLPLYAAGYDGCGDYMGPVSASWTTSGTLEAQTGTGQQFTFVPAQVGGVGTVVAADNQGHVAETGRIVVAYSLPDIQVAPATLSQRVMTGHQVTRTLTISNAGGVTLTYDILPNQVVTTQLQPFEAVFEWDGAFFIDTALDGGSWSWDYYITPEGLDTSVVGGQVQVTDIEVETTGMNLGEWINWDWEVHLSNEPLGWPEGQLFNSKVNPGKDYSREAPCQFVAAMGEAWDPRSHVYVAEHSFATDETTVDPYFGYVKRNWCAAMPMRDGLYARVFAWTGDSRVEIQFDSLRLVVRGVVTRDYGDYTWLKVQPTSGRVPPGESRSVSAVLDATGLMPGMRSAAISVQSNDLEDALVVVPVAFDVAEIRWTYLPVVRR